MAEKQFAKGVNVKSVQTQYGEIIKIGINVETIKENPSNNGWVNIDIKHSKEGKVYQELNTYSGG